MGLIDELLNSLEVEVRAFALCNVETGWALALDSVGVPIIHYVLRGSGTLRPSKGPALVFAAHDFILLPAARRIASIRKARN